MMGFNELVGPSADRWDGFQYQLPEEVAFRQMEEPPIIFRD
jgi:hypothetical protein